LWRPVEDFEEPVLTVTARVATATGDPEPEPLLPVLASTRLKTGPAPPLSDLAGEGLCLLELVLPDLPDFPDLEDDFSVDGRCAEDDFSTEAARLELLLDFLEHRVQFQMSLGSLASWFDTGGEWHS